MILFFSEKKKDFFLKLGFLMCRHRQQQCKCATWIQFSILNWALSKLNACSNVTQILPRLWAYIEIIVLEQINDSSSPAEKHWWSMPKHKSRTWSGFQVCLTMLNPAGDLAAECKSWVNDLPYLHLPAPQEVSFLHWVKVSVLEGTCRKSLMVFWEATACEPLLCTCKVGLCGWGAC